MNFLIISHVEHSQKDGLIYGYGPYIKEMNLWLKDVQKVRIVAPMRIGKPDQIDLPYNHQEVYFDKVPAFSLVSAMSKIMTLIFLPYIVIRIFIAMIWADHIHLRCPGNMGLLGAVIQVFFPWKSKTVKYAGNWDPESSQPLTYRIQKWIISNPVLSKNIQVLVYGEWPNQSKNIVEFFTASYHESEKEDISPRNLEQEIKLVFVGALSPGKRPMIAVQALHGLVKNNLNARLDLMGEGVEREVIESYIEKNKLSKYITLHGNQNADFVKDKFKSAHFLILMSKSEGWPKVVAEAMFWGCVPITSNVSCVNYMIGEGRRGSLVEAKHSSVSDRIQEYIKFPSTYEKASLQAVNWSRQFTLESFEISISNILNEGLK